MYEKISTLVPKKILRTFTQELLYNHIEIDGERFTGFLFLYSFFLSIGIAANAFIFLELHPLIVFVVSFAGLIFLAYALMKMSSDSKGRFVENILPDALQIVASNMKSGMTTERALFVAGRPEFGLLETELKNASKRISSGEKVETALHGIGERIDSISLKKTLWLISQGVRSGGQMADLLFQLSDDLKNQNAIRDQIRADISIYILLIFFTAAFGAPLLFGVSSFIVEVLSAQLANTPTINVSQLPTSSNFGAIRGFASGTGDAVSSGFIIGFSMIALAFTVLFSSLTIGVINNGKEIDGLRYLIPLAVVSFLVFFAMRAVMATFFGSLL